jgi:hypothetical protein
MKPAIAITIGAIALFAALMRAVVEVLPDAPSVDRKSSENMPTGTFSELGVARSPIKRRLREPNPQSEFLRYLSKIEPNTDFQDPSDGYFQAYLKVRSAESLLDGCEHDNDRLLVLYENAYALFLGVIDSAPDWKVEMVRTRLEKTKNGLRDAYFAKNGR